MSWQDIETAPRDGSTVRVGKRKFFQQQPTWPLRARFLDGRWLTDYGHDTWRSFDPQPNCWLSEQVGTERSGVDQTILPQTEKGS